MDSVRSQNQMDPSLILELATMVQSSVNIHYCERNPSQRLIVNYSKIKPGFKRVVEVISDQRPNLTKPMKSHADF